MENFGIIKSEIRNQKSEIRNQKYLLVFRVLRGGIINVS